MFAVPIDQSGLSSFVPVRRQSGSSVGLQNLGFNVFGQPIGTLPSLSDRRNLAANQALDIGGTDIGRIKQTGLASFVPLDGNRELGFDEEEGPQSTGPQSTGPQGTINQPSSIDFGDIGDKIGDKVDEFGSKFSSFIDDPIPTFNPDKGPLGTVENIFGGLVDDVNVAQKGTEVAVEQGLLAALGNKAFIAAPFADLLVQSAFGKGDFIENIEGRDVAFSVGKGIAGLALGPLGPLVVSAIQALISLFSDPDYDGEGSGPGGAGSPAGSAVDAAMGGLGIQFGKGPEYSFWSGLTDPGFEDPDEPAFTDDYSGFGNMGPNIASQIAAAKAAQQAEDFAAATSGPGGFGDTGQMGGPTGSGGIDSGEGTDGDADGSDDGADGDADACWVAGTQVLMGDCTYRNIEDLKIGDVVMSFPEDKKTRKWTTELEAKPIISLSVNRSRNIWHLNDTMVTGREWIVKGDGTAALVMWLQEGDTVMGADGEPIDIYRVEAAEGPLSSQITYTFETQNNFSYTADNFRTLRGRAVRAPEDWVYAKDVPTGSMQDEYNKKFSKLAA